MASFAEAVVDSRAGWVGKVADCAEGLAVLLKDGKIEYDRAPSDPASETFMMDNTAGLVHLFKMIPKGNGKYSMFVKGILKLMADDRYGGAPSNKKGQLKEAEEVAVILRTVCFHIRRGWYRKTSAPWMDSFPRPAGHDARAPASGPPVVSTAAPSQVSSSPDAHRAQPAPHSAALLQACHAEGSDLYAMMLTEIEEEALDDDDFGMEANDELVYVFGFDGDAKKDAKAWRKLVDNEGEDVMGKEFASHCTKPSDGVGLMIGHWLDGTEQEIPGMLVVNKRKRSSSDATQPSLKKRPASNREGTPSKCESMEQPEEESDFSPDECVEPDAEAAEEFVDKYVETHNLQTEALNGKVFKVTERREDGRLLCEPIFAGTPRFWASADKLKLKSNKELVPFLQTVTNIDDIDYWIKGATQGSRPCIITVKTSDGVQYGMVSARLTDNDIVQAFSLTNSVMTSLKKDSLQQGWEGLSRAKFFTKRDALSQPS